MTPVVNPGYASQLMPLTGSYQLVVDGNLYGVPQPVGSTFVLTELQAGQHTLGAVFLGDEDYQKSTTSTSTVTVVPAELTVTADNNQRPETGLEPSKVVLYHFAQHSVRHGDPLERYGGRYNAPPLASRHRLQTLGT